VAAGQRKMTSLEKEARATNNWGHGFKLDLVEQIKFFPRPKNFRNADYDQPIDYKIKYRNRWYRVMSDGLGFYYLRVDGRPSQFHKYTTKLDISDKNIIEMINWHYRLD